MDSIEPPSFSLGFDLDAELESHLPSRESPTPLGFSCKRAIGDNDNELDLRVSDKDIEPKSEPGQVLKRLRRGIAAEKCCAINREAKAFGCRNDWDDEIEEFSSPEDLTTDGPALTKYHSVCGSSKVPLHGPGFLTSQPSSQWKAKSRSQQLGAQVLGGSGTASSISSFFQKSTRSPLRRFQLLDSDSEEDHPSTSKDVSKVTSKSDLSTKDLQYVASEPKKKKSCFTPQIEDLWKDFSPKSVSIPTPALDNLCEEYFHSLKDNNAAGKPKSVGTSNSTSRHNNFIDIENIKQSWDFADPHPPSHRYFLHKDPRIQNLVRNRLANFVPLGIVDDNGDQRSTFLIDYMSQFGNGEASKREGIRKSGGKISRGVNKSKVSKAPEALHSSEGWVDPRSSSTVPKDAGRRRVSANGGSAGHWYTSPEGRKVYVSRDGQELTGQSAYRRYRKEREGGLKKSKKKRQTSKSRR